MQFIVYCRDKPPGTLRAQVRAKHLQFALQVSQTSNPVIFGGPLLTPENRIVGSFYIVEMPDRAALDAFLARDPYFQNEIFESVEIHGTRQMLPEPQPGVLSRAIEEQLAKDRGG